MPRKPRFTPAQQKKAEQQAGWCLYFARPTLGDVADVLVAYGMSEATARRRACEMNARLPDVAELPCNFYYAAHGQNVLPGMAAFDQWLDATAEVGDCDLEEANGEGHFRG